MAKRPKNAGKTGKTGKTGRTATTAKTGKKAPAGTAGKKAAKGGKRRAAGRGKERGSTASGAKRPSRSKALAAAPPVEQVSGFPHDPLTRLTLGLVFDDATLARFVTNPEGLLDELQFSAEAKKKVLAGARSTVSAQFVLSDQNPNPIGKFDDELFDERTGVRKAPFRLVGHEQLTQLMLGLVLRDDVLDDFIKDPEALLVRLGFTAPAREKILRGAASTISGQFVLSDQNPKPTDRFDNEPFVQSTATRPAPKKRDCK